MARPEAAKVRTPDRQLPDELGELGILDVGAGEGTQARSGRGLAGLDVVVIAEVIGRELKLPVVSVAAEDAGDHFGFLSAFVSADDPTSSALTQERLGWRPEGPALIPDIEQGHYFAV